MGYRGALSLFWRFKSLVCYNGTALQNDHIEQIDIQKGRSWERSRSTGRMAE